MTAAWFTNVAKTSDLVFQTESWGFDADKIVVGDETVENYSLPIAPGNSGIVPLRVDNSEGTESVQIGVTISKSAVGDEDTAMMDEEMQKRIFFYADTDKTYSNGEKVSKVYLGTSVPHNYAYNVLAGQQLVMNELYYNDVPLKWEWVYDMLGYYFQGTVKTELGEGETEHVTVEDYLRPIEYDFNQAVFDLVDDSNAENSDVTYHQLQAVENGTVTTEKFLEQISENDGYDGKIDVKNAVLIDGHYYYPVVKDNNGYGVWAYLCTYKEIQDGIAYDTSLTVPDEQGNLPQVSAQAKIVITANSVSAELKSVDTEEQLLAALSDSQTNIVQLSSEVSLSRPLAFTEGEKVIDLNGFGLDYAGTESEYSMITVGTDASLTLINGDVSGTTQATAYAALKTTAFNMEGGKLALSNISVSGVDTAVYVADMNAEAAGDSVVQINGCNLTGEQAAMILQGNGASTEATTKVMIYDSKLLGKYYLGISGQGNDDRWGTELVIAKSEVSGAYAAFYQPQRKSVTTITESTLSGNTGIAVKGGTVNIYDSKVTGTGEISVIPAAIAKSGFTDTGDGIYVEVAYGWSSAVTLKGKNNEVISDKAYAVEMIAEQGMGPGKVLIYEGTYKGQLGETKWNNIGTFERYDVTDSEAE